MNGEVKKKVAPTVTPIACYKLGFIEMVTGCPHCAGTDSSNSRWTTRTGCTGGNESRPKASFRSHAFIQSSYILAPLYLSLFYSKKTVFAIPFLNRFPYSYTSKQDKEGEQELNLSGSSFIKITRKPFRLFQLHFAMIVSSEKSLVIFKYEKSNN